MLTVGISGASGLIGTALTQALRDRGDRVIALVRRPAAGPDERSWDPAKETFDAGLAGVHTVVNLAGAGVGDKRWNTEHRAAILTSRVRATRTIVAAIEASGEPIALVNGSAVGAYGDRGEEVLTESSPRGVGFLAEVVRAWEDAAAPLVEAGRPVSFARTGLVMTQRGGALAPLLRATRLGAGGPLGSGKQYWPIISLRDEVAALMHLIDHPEITGPVNLVGVEPPRQREVAAELGRLVHRPSVLPAPGFALRLVVGEFAGEILASQRVVPERLLATGFEHRDASVDEVLAAALAG
ncbi:MAG TPA: TIGR01777 family oxidoreductase [Tetrasphaera sp.]|uniref:TIGR01777 family oxidoreductase n=1 Tax=Nostocoides sp. TaxID=1917966 RepID=UPI002C67F7F6|nr:TIGR01777 family oxidoreductase [Tetrasphaera sp.]HNQ07679.1 TIGR01777 family oxidoreductase [Tetrasphaera sp.]